MGGYIIIIIVIVSVAVIMSTKMRAVYHKLSGIEEVIEDVRSKVPQLRNEVEEFEKQIQNLKDLGESFCLPDNKELQECYGKLGGYLWSEYSKRVEHMMILSGFLLRVQNMFVESSSSNEDDVQEVPPPPTFTISPTSTQWEELEKTVTKLKHIMTNCKETQTETIAPLKKRRRVCE